MGYGGSCFPKDVQAFIRTGHEHDVGMTLSTAVEGVNKRQKKILMSKIRDVFGQGELRNMTFAVWGLAFKPRTDDTREAPALTICSELLNDGVKLQVFDPEANETFRERFGEQAGLSYCETNFDALSGADALVICTEWNEFRRPNFERIKQMLKQPVIFDGRNLFRREEMERLGFHYYSIGRPAVNAL